MAGPGFLNLFLSDAWFRHALEGLREQGDRFGAGVVPPAERERILVEFVSANPTGPLTAAGGRHAAYGDSLARVLEFAGHEVEREYYVNDYGTQIELFGRSIAARMRGEPCPRADTRATTCASSPSRLRDEGLDPSDLESLTRRGLELMVERGAGHLGALPRALRPLLLGALAARRGRGRARRSRCSSGWGHVYTSEGATWLRTTRLRRRQGSRAAALVRRARRTSRPTSPTTTTSASAATTG